MNPNGQNQWWSKWEFTVWQHTGFSKPQTQESLKQNIGRFARRMFGEAIQIRAKYDLFDYRGKLFIHILVEKSDGVAHDPQYCKYVQDTWTAFLVSGFGPNTVVEMKAKLMAGSKQDGTPSEQMMILTGIPIFGQDNPDNQEAHLG